ncbi:MAG: hypothetical protein V4463_24565 [Pseudomonadota bacterium]
MTLKQLVATALLLGVAASAYALPLMEMRAEDLVAMAPDLKKSLNLNANQTILWQQVDGKARALLRERVSRRERLQQKTREALDGKAVELRDVAASVDAETATTTQEDRQLREWWLTVNDALDENQRQMVVNLVAEQLIRLPDSGAAHSAPRAKEEGGRERRGMGRKGGTGGPGT